MKAKLLQLWHTPVVNKATHTFWQTALAFFVAGAPLLAGALGKHDLNALQTGLYSLVVGAVGAGFSAVKTIILQWLTPAE